MALRDVETPDLLDLLGPLLERAERQRWRRLAEGNKPLGSYFKRWPHFRYASAIHSSPSTVWLIGTLQKYGAPELCTVIEPVRPHRVVESTPLGSAFTDVVSWGMDNYIVVCLPGRLAVSHDDHFCYTLHYRPD